MPIEGSRFEIHTTVREHMPKSHQAHLEWPPSRLIHWAETIGAATAQVVRTILESKPHPEIGYRACLGIMSLGNTYSHARLSAEPDELTGIGDDAVDVVRGQPVRRSVVADGQHFGLETQTHGNGCKEMCRRQFHPGSGVPVYRSMAHNIDPINGTKC